MSYCTLPRLTFSGQFQADVSTVNNDVRHYDDGSFEARFQEPQAGSSLNGWWNPEGTGAFRLVDVRVTQALTTAGGDGTSDDAHGLIVDSQSDRTSAKLVDLDPQFQMGSTIFGLQIVLTDGTREFMRGTYRSSAFRDIYFGRKAATGGSGSASAKFTSILTDVAWTPDAEASPTLRALQAASEANGHRLAVNLMTVGFSTRTTLGTLTGSIGPYEDGDPETFASGRRFAVANGGMATSLGIGWFDAAVAGDVLSLDLSNALPLQAGPGAVLAPVGTGPLFPAILRTPDTVIGPDAASPSVAAGIAEGQTVPASDLKLLSDIPYLGTGGSRTPPPSSTACSTRRLPRWSSTTPWPSSNRARREPSWWRSGRPWAASGRARTSSSSGSTPRPRAPCRTRPASGACSGDSPQRAGWWAFDWTPGSRVMAAAVPRTRTHPRRRYPTSTSPRIGSHWPTT